MPYPHEETALTLAGSVLPLHLSDLYDGKLHIHLSQTEGMSSKPTDLPRNVRKVPSPTNRQ